MLTTFWNGWHCFHFKDGTIEDHWGAIICSRSQRKSVANGSFKYRELDLKSVFSVIVICSQRGPPPPVRITACQRQQQSKQALDSGCKTVCNIGNPCNSRKPKKEKQSQIQIFQLQKVTSAWTSEYCSCCVWSFVWSQVLAVGLEHIVAGDKASIVETASPGK